MLNNRHLGSGWTILGKRDFAEFTLFPLPCLNPGIQKGDAVFELGVGTGGALHVEVMNRERAAAV